MSDDRHDPDGGLDPTVPALCERCWFPILPGQTARRTPVQVTGPAFSASLISFVHCAPSCTAQEDEDPGSEAA
ncbi:hypothetical protein [Actinomycetospora sp. TBRC 11914]|uniref:hypothetical protein n=1 Tax=Actinomycetospora sp. TBRC 11914 TaxID=2729387 RepID=UPI00145F26E1|nr:hypothetical protein [Actinomycetospora sp. TBRC 11914]NMO89442.1 hypothetical protein [Actinomycetospora sp. TBRC 11914]